MVQDTSFAQNKSNEEMPTQKDFQILESCETYPAA